MTKAELEPSPDDDYTAVVSALSDGWVSAMGVRFLRVTPTEATAELEIGPQHLQPLGVVHGGVYAGLIETVTSVGAGVNARLAGRLNVGLENHTSFLHAVRSGVLRATARPLTRGRRTQVWEATITDDQGRIAAQGQVRFLVLEQDSPLAGEGARLKPAR
jgi:uncharacterized protein (TIGR00369 family)